MTIASLAAPIAAFRRPRGISLWSFIGPGCLIAVGYMDPGNWATDIAGGSRFGYALLPVVIASSLCGILLQYLALKLGLATGKNLAEHCREAFPMPVAFSLWLAAEGMIVACDLAEVIGTAIALNLLFGLPLLYGVVVTGFDTLIFLSLQRRGFGTISAMAVVVVVTVVCCFVTELVLAGPRLTDIAYGLARSDQIFHSRDMLYLGIGILGATVMPHNLYLHSELAKKRRTDRSFVQSLRLASLDSFGALTLAGFVNIAILMLAASTFYISGHHDIADISQAYHMLEPILGGTLGAMLFGTALLMAAQSSTIAATMAGESIMQGFLQLKIAPWKRRLVTRSLAIIPAVVIIIALGDKSLGTLLISSQVILCMQLPLAIIPLILFTSRKQIMHEARNHIAVTITASVIGLLILSGNCWLLFSLIT